jgi:hypothetical protein
MRDQAPTFHLPGREFYLFEGQIEGATTPWSGGGSSLASMWWPGDEAWCVATEIDFDTTYVGGSRSCIDSLLGEASIEALEAAIDHKIGKPSDAINS